MSDTTLADYFYFLAVVGGPILLGLAVAYGFLRSRKTRMRSPSELQSGIDSDSRRTPSVGLDRH
ncbi:MAG TPA: hypothetical protein VEB20_14545 [Azospirillaceae bacterium]|nr:hypothetical protein [Azospirillaceae bacterium]